MSMPCGSLLLGVQCCYPYFFFLSFYLRTWLMLYWRATSLCLGSLLFRMLFPYGVIVIYNNLNTQLELISICLLHYLIYSFFLFGRATLLPAIKRFLPEHWNQDVITWHFPYFRCMWCPLFLLYSNYYSDSWCESFFCELLHPFYFCYICSSLLFPLVNWCLYFSIKYSTTALW